MNVHYEYRGYEVDLTASSYDELLELARRKFEALIEQLMGERSQARSESVRAEGYRLEAERLQKEVAELKGKLDGEIQKREDLKAATSEPMTSDDGLLTAGFTIQGGGSFTPSPDYTRVNAIEYALRLKQYSHNEVWSVQSLVEKAATIEAYLRNGAPAPSIIENTHGKAM